MNNASVNVCAQVLCGHMFSFLLGGTAGSHGNSVYPFEELPDYFPKQLRHFSSPPALYGDSGFLTLSAWVTMCLSVNTLCSSLNIPKRGLLLQELPSTLNSPL